MPCACQIPVPQYPETADWGPILWTILHGLAERAGSAAIPMDEVREWPKLIQATGLMLPCDKCRAHFTEFSKTHPITAGVGHSALTQFSNVPYSQIKTSVKTWFWELHNEINQDNNKPVFAYEDLTTIYSERINFQDLFWRLEPVIKKAIELSGVPLMKWMNWVKSFKMMRAILSV